MEIAASSVIARIDHRLVGLGLYRADTRPLVKLQSLLAAVAITTGLLIVAAGLMQRWYHGAGSGSVAVDVLFWIVWIAFDVAKIVLVGVLVATIYQWFRSSRPPRSQL